MKNIKIKERTSKYWELYFIHLFPRARPDDTIIAFGSTIFVPRGKGELPADIYAHESAHLKRQNYSFWGGIWWWIKYRYNWSFRLDEEIYAIAAQYVYLYARQPYSLVEKWKEIALADLAHPRYEFPHITMKSVLEKFRESVLQINESIV